MSSIKNQTKWVTKYFSSIVLAVLVIYGAMAYFTDKVGVTSFASAAFLAVILVLVLTYYGLMNIRSALTFVFIAVVLLAGVMYFDKPKVSAGQFQAVTLVGGQTYYGHLKNLNSDSATLTDVYTLQAQQQQASDGKSTTTKPILINLSKVLPDPENKMVISTDKILSWQNLQDNGKVAQAIKKDLGIK